MMDPYNFGGYGRDGLGRFERRARRVKAVMVVAGLLLVAGLVVGYLLGR